MQLTHPKIPRAGVVEEGGGGGGGEGWGGRQSLVQAFKPEIFCSNVPLQGICGWSNEELYVVENLLEVY